MDCASCAATIASALHTIEGVRDVQVDVVAGRVRVRYAEGTPDCGDLSGAIQRAIETLGFTVRPDGEFAVATTFWRRRGRLVMASGAGVFLLLGFALGWLGAPERLALAALGLSTLAGGWYVVPRGARAAMNRALDMNFLMSVAAIGAWIIGEPTEGAATLFLFSVAELLESYSMDRARHAIKALMDLSPIEARVVRGGEDVRVPASEVAVGELVIVRPGEKLPVDGEVVDGRSSVNQAPITGESMPVDKDAGAIVFAGSLNGQGVLRIRSTKPASDTTLARIIHSVEEAQSSRAPSQTFVDRFARVYTPVVVGIALLVAVLPPLVEFGSWETWIYRALTMLVVACPCALVISTPVSIVSGLAGAARAGVLIKGGVHLENLGRVSVVALDKTGTLTQGRPSVRDLVPLDGMDEDEMLRLAMGVERYSEHPLARAILEHGVACGLTPPQSSDFEALVGRGARAVVDGQEVTVGSHRLCGEHGGCGEDVEKALARLDAEGKTAVIVFNARRALGMIGIADRVRPKAREALAGLRALGVNRVVMLTGDNRGTARTIGQELGISEIHAELLPDDKVRLIRELMHGGARVAFIGDGVNDAPALAASTVGIAMGAAGTDVALETADVALMSDDLSKLAVAVRFSRKTVRIVRQNIVFALAVKAIFLVLAVSGHASLWMAVTADMGASLVVVANGLRAMHVRDPTVSAVLQASPADVLLPHLPEA